MPAEMRLFDMEEHDVPTVGRVGYAFEEDIGGGLGRVGMDAAGRLAGVELDERVMRTMDRTRAGRYLVDAVNRAEARARGEHIGRSTR